MGNINIMELNQYPVGQQSQYVPGGPHQQGYYPPNQPSYNQQPPYGVPGMVSPGYPPPMGSVNPASGEGLPMPQGYGPYGGQGMAPGYPPVMQQPQPQPMMVPDDCPPGLQYLAMVDQLIVKQQVELLEAFTGFETANKYKVLNTMGQEVYFAKEDTDCCNRMCCGPSRPFDMNITDGQGTEVIHLYRPLRCQGCCFPCCLQRIEVSSPPGTIIGTIEQNWSLCAPSFSILDQSGEPVLEIEGPCLPCSCFGDVEFEIKPVGSDEKVGRITKQWSGLAKEAFTDADNFGINFPIDLDVKVKATLLGALFLIDYMYFEESENKD